MFSCSLPLSHRHFKGPMVTVDCSKAAPPPEQLQQCLTVRWRPQYSADREQSKWQIYCTSGIVPIKLTSTQHTAGEHEETFAAVVLWCTTIIQVHLDGTTVCLDTTSYPRISSAQKPLNFSLFLTLFAVVYMSEWHAEPLSVSFFSLKQHKSTVPLIYKHLSQYKPMTCRPDGRWLTLLLNSVLQMGNNLNMLHMLAGFPVPPSRVCLAPLKQGHRNHLWGRGINTEDSDTASNMSMIISNQPLPLPHEYQKH